MRAIVEISCFTCRKCKNAQLDEHVCVYRDGDKHGKPFVTDKPCENWLPPKRLVRIRLQREAMRIAEQDLLIRQLGG